jgi:hypothetical protein
MSEDRLTKEEILADRKAAGLVIDVETCEIWSKFCNFANPYGVDPGCSKFRPGMGAFVRSAESVGWMFEEDLPDDRRRPLRDRIDRIDRAEAELSALGEGPLPF